MSRIDSLELWVLSVARKVFLLVAGVAMVAMVLGAVVAFASGVYFVGKKPAEPIYPPAPPALPAVSLDDARKVIEGKQLRYEPADYLPEVRDRDALAAADRLKALYPAPDFDWEDTIETVCTAQTSYGCLSRDRRVTKVGVRRWVATFMGVLQDKQFPVEEGLGRALQLLPKVNGAERVVLAPAIVLAVQERNQKQAAQDDEHEQRVNALQNDFEQATLEHRVASVSLLTTGLSLLGGGLGLVLSICLMVAVLAIERHLRVAGTEARA